MTDFYSRNHLLFSTTLALKAFSAKYDKREAVKLFTKFNHYSTFKPIDQRSFIVWALYDPSLCYFTSTIELYST